MKKLFIFCSILLCMTFVAQSETRHVPDEYETIQDGIDAAEEGDTVLVQRGQYSENILFRGQDIYVVGDYRLDEDLSLDYAPVIDGGEEGSVVTFSSGETESCGFIGFIIQNGLSDEGGGGITVQGSSPTLRNLRVTGCIAEGDGGGGIQCNGTENMIIENVTIMRNVSAWLGGGILLQNCISTIMRHCYIVDNHASEDGSDFAAISSSLNEMTNCVFSTAPDYGACFYSFRSNINCTQVYVFSERAIDCYDSHLSILSGVILSQQCLIAKNSDIIMTNMTIISEAPQDGSVFQIMRGNLTVTNSIIWGSRDSDILTGWGGGDSIADTFEYSYNNIIGLGDRGIDAETVEAGDGNIDTDPLFLDPDNTDYNITAESPCIDAGDPDSPLDPDGTRSDMGAFYFHQRDVEQNQYNIVFEPINWEETSSQTFEIKNVGGTDLHLTALHIPNHLSFFSYYQDLEEEPVTIPPDSSYLWLIVFHPQYEGYGQAMFQTAFSIETDDPDEQFIDVIVSGDVLSIDNEIEIPASFTLSAYPNPFNSSATITYRVGANSNSPVSISIYDLSGRLVDMLVNGIVPAGNHSVVWDASGVGAGVYFVRLEGRNEQQITQISQIKKVVVIK